MTDDEIKASLGSASASNQRSPDDIGVKDAKSIEDGRSAGVSLEGQGSTEGSGKLPNFMDNKESASLSEVTGSQESLESFKQDKGSCKLPNPPGRPLLICVDGTISSGKSTLIRNLGEKGFEIYPEPLEKWAPQLRKFYANPRKEFVNLQTVVLNSQAKLKEKLKAKLTEVRSQGSRYIFIERNTLSQLYFIYNGLDLRLLTQDDAIDFLDL